MRHDRAATAAYYQTIAQGDADVCGCSFCRNFALQRSTAFPTDFMRLLDQLGIDADKEAEAFDWGPVGDGLRRYGGWFCFVGGYARSEPDAIDELVDGRFSFAFTNSFPWRGALARERVVAVHFIAHLPWLLPIEDMDPALR